jgi:hypothetical protein
MTKKTSLGALDSPFDGGLFESTSNQSSGGYQTSNSTGTRTGGEKFGGKHTVLETDLGKGPSVETRVNTRESARPGEERDYAEEYRQKHKELEEPEEPEETETSDQPKTEGLPKNILVLLGAGIAAYLIFSRKRRK